MTWCLALSLAIGFQVVLCDSPHDGDKLATQVLTQMVRSGASRGFAPDFAVVRDSLEASRSFGMMAILYIFGVPDSKGRLEFPNGFPRDLALALRYAAKGALTGVGGDGWSFTALGLLLSLGYPPLRCVQLEVLPGPWVHFEGLEDILRSAAGTGSSPLPKCKKRRRQAAGDLAGAAYWAAAERKEPLGAIAFASLLRRNLTDVPSTWHSAKRALLTREPFVFAGASQAQGSADLACRALGTLIGPASAASGNEEPLLDRAALTWKAWRHRVRKMPEEPDWKETKEYVETVRFRAEQLQEPEAQRELGAVHYEGHTEGDVEQSRASATGHWEAAARKGDIWSAWYTALVTIQDGRPQDAHEFLDMVAQASAGALSFMAMHFKFRFGLGSPASPEQAGLFLKAAADLGYSNAQLILAHAYSGHTHGNMAGVYPPGGPNQSLALEYYKIAASNGRLTPKFNVGLLTAQGADPEISDPNERCLVAYRHFSEIILQAHAEVHVMFAHARRAFDLGDEVGALLRFALLSDTGALNAHLNAAYLWDRLAASARERQGEAAASSSAVPGQVAEELPCWIGQQRAARGSRAAGHLSECAFYYHRRAASVGHVSSMHELSSRLLEATRLPSEVRRRSPEGSAHAWTALAAELGDSRGIFDLAYMYQFGIGCEENATHAEELYYHLLRDGDWSARIAALSGLGLQRLRAYFFHAESPLRPVAGYLQELGAWLGGGLAAGWSALSWATSVASDAVRGAAAAAAAGEPLDLGRVVIRDRFGGTPGPSGGGPAPQAPPRRMAGRLIYEVVE